jgi:thiol-disulfide isomerase/thioredoxin
MPKHTIKQWLLVLLCWTGWSFAAQAAPPRVGEWLPDLEAAALQGRLPERSGKVILLDFWASWCAPCKASFPVLDQLYNTYRSRGFEVIAVSVDDEAVDMKRFLEDHPASFAILHDARKQLVEQMAPEAMPTSYLIGRDGRIRSIHAGFNGRETEEALRAEIEKLLGTP